MIMRRKHILMQVWDDSSMHILPSPLASPKGRVSSGMLTTSAELKAAAGILTGT